MINETMRARLTRVQGAAFIVGILALIACLVGAFLSTRQFFIAYLFGYLYWLGLALGCFGVAMIHHLTGGRWGFVVRRFMEAGFMTLPVMAILFIPLLFGLHDLYPWAKEGAVALDKITAHRHAYMNTGWFIVRFLFFFAVWIVMAWLLRRWSLEQDETTDLTPTRRMRTLSGPGIVIYPITATFAYVDWLMSIEAHWYSTIFLVIVLIGQILSAVALAIVMLSLFKEAPPVSRVVSETHFHHLGNLLLAFVMFWTYVAFSQVLVIYAGNLPHEITWYLHRIKGGWKYVVGFLAAFHFFIPFFVLLFRPTKKRSSRLVAVAVVILLAHIVNVFWLIMPSFAHEGVQVHWLDIVAPIGVGGVWLTVFIAGLKGPPLLPRNDPRIEYSLADAK